MKAKVFKAVTMTLLALTMILPLNVFADISNIKVDGGVDINSTGSSGEDDQIIVTVPTALYFTVTPNEEQLITSIPDIITNQGNRPVQVGVVGYEAFNNNQCKVVNQDTYTDTEWQNLGKSDTESKIALGIKHNTDIYWSPEGVNSDTTKTIGTFNIFSKQEEQVEVAVKCGSTWSSDRVLDYSLYFVLS